MLRFAIDNLKNLKGWHTSEKLVVFSVDDYGNVRLDSKRSRDRLLSSGIQLVGRFDLLDTLETRQDLEALLDTLSCVKDVRGSHAIFTPYALCANPNFDKLNSGTDEYIYEDLPSTFERLEAAQPSSYSGAWSLWNEAVRSGFLKPQFHGREHLNIKLIESMLVSKSKILSTNIRNKSMAGLIEPYSFREVGFTESFGISKSSDIEQHEIIIRDGLNLFQKVFGYRSLTFTPPAQKLHPNLYPLLESCGVRGIDKPFHTLRRLDLQHSVREINWTGKQKNSNHITLVRNVVFEPTLNRNFDSVKYALNQIRTSFRFRKPAIISSHRVNFCGHIDEDNRSFGLKSLKLLLESIVLLWPDVQFINAVDLIERIEKNP